MSSIIKKRHSWMDAMRGMSILLVINTHAIDSVVAKYSDVSQLFQLLMNITSLFSPLRMPIMVFLSGLLFFGSASKGYQKFFSGKIKNIIYPFFVWTFIMYLVYQGRYLYLGESSSFNLLKSLTIEPFHYLWFLYYLFIFYTLTYFLSKGNLLFCMLACIVSYFIFTGYERFTSLFLFFLIGAYIGRDIIKFSFEIKKASLSFLFLCLMVSSLFFMILHYNKSGSYSVYYALSALFIIPVIIRLFLSIEGSLISRCLEYFGVGSIVFYLSHVPILMTLPVIFVKYYSGSASIIYVLCMFLTLVSGAFLLYAKNKYKLPSLLFSPPSLSRIDTIIKEKRNDTLRNNHN